jgi:hypothetical protein
MATIQLIKVRTGLMILLLLEFFATLYLIKEEVRIKNHLAAWPRSSFAQKAAEIVQTKPAALAYNLASWEKALTEVAETRNGLLQLAILYYQLYQDEPAKAYWQRAFYLDPLFVSSLPTQLY